MFPSPPKELVQADDQDIQPITEWTEEKIKTCLYLFLELLCVNHSNIHS